MNMNAKEKWINEIENSLDGIRQAEPKSFFYTRLKQRLANREEYIPSRFIWLTSVSLALVLLLNVFVLSASKSSKNTESGELRQLSGELVNTNLIDYR